MGTAFRAIKQREVKSLNKINYRKRFLDDLWFLWRATQRQFKIFLAELSAFAVPIALTFKG